MPNASLILASRSPRRAMLLRDAGFEFEQADPPFDDPAHPASTGQSPEQIACDIAAAKAMSFRGSSLLEDQPGAVLLAADTLIVHANGDLAGTPTSRPEAEAMIRRFMNVEHAVVSAAAIWSANMDKPATVADTAIVHVGEIDDATLQSYLDSDAWQGKAGGYNLFDRQRAGWPITVQGDAATVVGLPMRLLATRLRAHGITPAAQPRSARP